MTILYKTDVIEKKNKVFAFFRKSITEKEVRKELSKSSIKVDSLIASGQGFMIFNIDDNYQSPLEELAMTDLTMSYGASSLEEAPSEITDPEVKPKPARRRRTRKTTTKTTK